MATDPDPSPQPNSGSATGTCEQLKEEGNQKFKLGHYQKALELYKKSLSQLEQEESAHKKDIRLSCEKNCAACCLKLELWTQTVSHCNSALEISPGDAKALFRRCQAYEKLEMWKDALTDVRQLLRLEAGDSSVQDLARRVSAKAAELNDTQNTTSHLVNEMLNALEDTRTDNEKLDKACNNLLVLSSEVGGSNILVESENLARLAALLASLKQPANVARVWTVLAYLSKNEVLANKVKAHLQVTRIRSGLGSSNESISDAATHFCQAYLDALLEIDPDQDRTQWQYKGDREKFKPMCLDLVDLLVDIGLSGIGRDNCVRLLTKNFLRRGGCGLMLLMISQAVITRMLRLVAKKDPKLTVTVNTPMNVAMFLHKFFEDLQSDSERNTFKEYIESFVKPMFEEDAKAEDKSRGMQCLIVLLQGPRDVGSEMISTLNAVNVMLELAQSSSVKRQKVALDCIIQASAKASVGSTLLQGGVEVLQELFKSPDSQVRAKALVGLCKTGSAGGSDKSSKVLDNESMFGLAEECRFLMQNEDTELVKCGVDGIAFLSLDADVKEDLVGDPEALTGLYKVGKCEDQSILHSVSNILVNLTNAYDKPEPNPELEKLAQFAKYHVPEPHPYDSEEYVTKRINKLVSTGVIEGLVNAHKSESDATKEAFSRVFFAISKEVDHRGKIAQQGGVRTLLELSNSGNKRGQLFAAHALSRVAISLNPEQAFPGQRVFELIRPLVKLLHIDCTALQNFEALLALTNITHVYSAVVDRLIKDKHTDKIEQYMYEDHDMLRQASVECVVNMVHHSQEMADRFAIPGNDRVKLWTLYCAEHEDNAALASAAAGGLAILTAGSKAVCQKITEVNNWMGIMKELLVHENVEFGRRAVHIVSNMVSVGGREVAEEIADGDMLEILMALTLAPEPQRAPLKPLCEDTLKELKKYGLIKDKPANPQQQGDA